MRFTRIRILLHVVEIDSVPACWDLGMTHIRILLVERDSYPDPAIDIDLDPDPAK